MYVRKYIKRVLFQHPAWERKVLIDMISYVHNNLLYMRVCSHFPICIVIVDVYFFSPSMHGMLQEKMQVWFLSFSLFFSPYACVCEIKKERYCQSHLGFAKESRYKKLKRKVYRSFLGSILRKRDLWSFCFCFPNQLSFLPPKLDWLYVSCFSRILFLSRARSLSLSISLSLCACACVLSVYICIYISLYTCIFA